MIRSVLGKVAWVGRTASMVFGLALVMALVIGVATTALGATGGTFILGQPNSADAPTTLTWTGNTDIYKAALVLKNLKGGFPLQLQAGAGIAPMKVNSGTKVAKLNADRLDGKDFSAFGAANVIFAAGPLPREGTYTSKGGTLLISASGSGYRSTRTHGDIGMRVKVDGTTHGDAQVFTSEINSHKAFVDEYVVVRGLPAGQHTIRLEAIYSIFCNTTSETTIDPCTTTNGDDIFKVAVLEIPD